MTAPAVVEYTWPYNAPVTFTYEALSLDDGSLVTTGTVVFQMRTSAGGNVGAPINGTHEGAGTWRIRIPALGLTLKALYHPLVTITPPGVSPTPHEWWVRAVELRPRLVGGP